MFARQDCEFTALCFQLDRFLCVNGLLSWIAEAAIEFYTEDIAVQLAAPVSFYREFGSNGDGTYAETCTIFRFFADVNFDCDGRCRFCRIDSVHCETG